jgi:hypothetical protein
MLNAGWLRGCGTLLLLAAAGCSHGPSDALLTADAQNRLLSDQRIQGDRIAVAASHGVLTLSGTVRSEAERNAASEDASRADGLNVLVNNLRIVDPGYLAETIPSPKPPAAHPVLARSAPSPVVTPAKTQQAASAAHEQGARSQLPVAASNPASALPTAPSDSSTSTGHSISPAAQIPLASVMPAAVEKVSVPAGTVLSVRLLESVGSDVNDAGDKFTASLASPVMIGDKVVIPAEAGIHGRVVQVQSGGRFSGKPSLVLELNELAYNGKDYSLRSSAFSKEGSSRTTRTAETVGSGAGIGAIVGAMVAGGRGAAIGAAIGAGIGTGVQARSKGSEVQLPAETVLSFRLKSPIEVDPSPTLLQAPNSNPDSSSDPFPNDRPVLKQRPGSGAADTGPDMPSSGTIKSPAATPPDGDSPPVLKRRPN